MNVAMQALKTEEMVNSGDHAEVTQEMLKQAVVYAAIPCLRIPPLSWD